MSFFTKIFGRRKSKQKNQGEEKQRMTTVDELVAELGHGEFNNKYRAMERLVIIGEPAVEPLIAALEDLEDEDKVALAVRALGEIGDARALEPLVELYENTPSWTINNAAGISMGKLGDPRGIAKYVDRLGYVDAIDSIKTLVEIGPAAVEPVVSSLHAMSEENEYTTRKANHIKVLGMLGDARAADVLKALTAPEKEDRLRNAALEALSKLNQPLEISQEEVTNLKDALLVNDYNGRKTALAQARLVASSVDDADFQRAFRANEKLQMAYDNQRKAASGNEPMRACHEAIELEPDFSAAYVCLSYLHCEYAKKPNDALQWAKKAIQIDPENAEAWTALGKAYVVLREASEAARAFHKVVTLEPQHPNLEPLARLVAVYRVLGMQDRLGKALVRLNKAGIGLDPDQEREWEQIVMAADKKQLRKVILE